MSFREERQRELSFLLLLLFTDNTMDMEVKATDANGEVAFGFGFITRCCAHLLLLLALFAVVVLDIVTHCVE